jgi:glycosyltransferase involved in cell wall biosynthesis
LKMSELKKKKLIVVLGMHRCGTSAVTRALKVMGVSLGDKLMPALADNNAKGFWEDIDVNVLNEDMLQSIGSDWNHVAPLSMADLELLRSSGYPLRAVELLRQKMDSVAVFGLKNPRLAKLFPFWKEVFDHCAFDVRYVLAIRHPLSVAKSLAQRDGIESQQSHILWLGHMIGSLLGSRGKSPVVIDYDRLIQFPDNEVARLAAALDLSVDAAELGIYKNQFLSPDLRHTRYSLDDFGLDNSCPPIVRELYATLLDAASAKHDVDDSRLQSRIADWEAEFQRLSGALLLVDKLLGQCNAMGVAADAAIRNAGLTQSGSESAVPGAGMLLQLHERKLALLGRAISDRDAQIVVLRHLSAEQEDQIVSRDAAAFLQGAKIESLQQEMRVCSDHVSAVERQAGVVVAELEVARQKNVEQVKLVAQITEMNANALRMINEIHASTSWKITKPVRVLSRFSQKIVKASGLVKQGSLARYSVMLRTTVARAAVVGDNLPGDFDPATYLRLNTDVADSGVDPVAHYLRHGKREGRPFAMPRIPLNYNHRDGYKTILVVSHEASRTGAPVLSLNLVQALVDEANVVVLLLGGGSLTAAFQETGATVIDAHQVRGNAAMADSVISQLCKEFQFKCAFVNSIESRLVLPMLAENAVPTVSLIHEFASYTRPRDAFKNALFWSGEVVFSASVTMDNAYTEFPELKTGTAHILPQGRCLVPSTEFSDVQRSAEQARLRNTMRPADSGEGIIVVLGAGAVQLRKGVDLFIECAAQVVRAPGGDMFRFVWIGKGFDPENDTNYSVYLADQIRRAGLVNHVFIMDETPLIDEAYDIADIFLLSSRLDPLPNVAIDAMSCGLPIVCFAKTTGIADFLITSDLAGHCVADYLDVADMAAKVSELGLSSALRDTVSQRAREAAKVYFNMPTYVARLIALADAVGSRIEMEQLDAKLIVESGLFRTDFACAESQSKLSVGAAIRFYVRAWASGIERRKPLPGFHPGMYLELHGLANIGGDPFADYLRAGKPQGPWNYPVIALEKSKEITAPSAKKIALHLHVHYVDLLPEIMQRLSKNKTLPDLFISITSDNIRDQVHAELKNYAGKVVDIQLVPNRGRDIGPFITTFGKTLIADYEIVGHLHTKRSASVADASMGAKWSNFLLENLLGGEAGAAMDQVIDTMATDPSIGMVFPDDPHVIGLSGNREFAGRFSARLGLGVLPEYFIFPVGTMFWARASALVPIMALNLSWDDYPVEPIPYDGTMLHAMERLFALSLVAGDLRAATTNIAGLSR